MSPNDTAQGAVGFRNKRTAPFTMLANAMLRDKRLSLKAKGLLGVMLSFPDDWAYYMEHLQGLSSDGRESHQTAMKELIAVGYVKRSPAKDPETGKLKGWQYLVSDESAGDGETVRRESRQTGKPSDGKPAATNTDYTKTESTKIKTHVISPDGEARAFSPSPVGDAEKQPHAPVGEKPKPSSQGSSEDNAACSEKVPGAAALAAAWNEHCGPLPRVVSMTKARVAASERLLKELGEQAPALFADAVREVALDPFWRERRYGFDNLLRGKVTQKAEAYRARQERVTDSPLNRRKYD